MSSPSQNYEDIVCLKLSKAYSELKRNSLLNMLLFWQNQSFSFAMGEYGENGSEFTWDHSRRCCEEDQ